MNQHDGEMRGRHAMGASRWTAALLLVVTFLLGISLGFIVRGPFMTIFRGPQRPLGIRGGAGGVLPPLFVNRIVRALDLTPAQEDELDRILEENQFKMMNLRREMRPRVRVITDSTRAAIEGMLTPEQLKKFRNIQRRIRRGRGGRRMPRLE